MSSIWQTKNRLATYRVSFLFDKLGDRPRETVVNIVFPQCRYWRRYMIRNVSAGRRCFQAKACSYSSHGATGTRTVRPSISAVAKTWAGRGSGTGAPLANSCAATTSTPDVATQPAHRTSSGNSSFTAPLNPSRLTTWNLTFRGLFFASGSVERDE